MKCKLKNIEINYEVMGEGKPILILSGFATDMKAMIGSYELIFREKEGWKRIYIDHPGVGMTKGESWIKNANNLLEVILGFVDSVIADENFLLIGHSFGCYIARGILKKRFDFVDGILLSCPVIIPEREKRDIDKDLEDIEFFDQEIERRINQRFENELVESTKNTDRDFLERLRENGIAYSFDVDKLERPFAKPALIVAGKQDNIVGYRDIIPILKNYPRSTFCIVDKGSHHVYIEQEELFKALAEEWLYRVDEYFRMK